MHRGKNSGNGPGIPKRWLHCPRNSNSFIAENFLAFKTPLSTKFSHQVPVECRFQPEMVFSYVKMEKVNRILSFIRLLILSIMLRNIYYN